MTLKPSFKFSLSFPGKIWQTALDNAAGVWALEVREPDTQKITYHLVYLKENERRELRNIAEADWWTVILRFYFPMLVLEKYNNPQDPTDKDLILYHVGKQHVLRTLEHFQFEGLTNNMVNGCNPVDQSEKKSFKLSDAGLNLDLQDNVQVLYPSYFSPISENIKIVQEFLGTVAPGIGCEYLETGNYIIISYYVRLGRKFERKLLVLKGDDELYHEVQDWELDGFASGAFFVFENLLVFIKNGNQINGVEL